MRSRLLLLIKLFACTVALFALQKPLFMLCYQGSHPEVVAADWLAVVYHALPLDITTSGYITALPWLLAMISWWRTRRRKNYNVGYVTYSDSKPQRHWLHTVLTVYYAIISMLMAVVFVADAVMYRYWGFKIDATVFDYIDKPGDAVASVSVWFVIATVVITLLLAALYTYLYYKVLHSHSLRHPRDWWSVFVMLPVGALLFLAIRGGVGEGTANVSRAYYSSNQYLNHAAVNPMFNMLYSMLHHQNFSKEFRFMDEAERSAAVGNIYTQRGCPAEGTQMALTDTLLNTPRPNVLLIIWEGCGAGMVESLGGAKGVTPQLDSIARNGVLFTQCYACSFRTDRGLVSIMSGWPGMPSASLMKIPEKCNQLPGLARSLADAGYTTDFWYGGDITFTNMRGYMLANGYQTVHSDADFTASERSYSKWGAVDGIVLDKVAADITARKNDASHPWFTTVLTLSSHEPWEVPYQRLDDKQQNSFAYTDHCLGEFIAKLSHDAQWQNTLVVITADHGVMTADSDTRYSQQVIRIPLIFTGGALSAYRSHTDAEATVSMQKPVRGTHIDVLMSQSDIAATLLSQLGIDHSSYRFSRNVLSPAYTYPTALHTSPADVTFVDSTGISTFDLGGRQSVTPNEPGDPVRIKKAKALLQTIYDAAAEL